MDYEFVSYERTPEDGLQLGVVTLLAFGKLALKYKHMTKKDNSGQYFASSSICITSNAQKTYHDSVMIDSRTEHDKLMSYLRQCVSRSHIAAAPANPSIFANVATTEHYPEKAFPYVSTQGYDRLTHGSAQGQAAPKPATQEQLPF